MTSTALPASLSRAPASIPCCCACVSTWTCSWLGQRWRFYVWRLSPTSRWQTLIKSRLGLSCDASSRPTRISCPACESLCPLLSPVRRDSSRRGSSKAQLAKEQQRRQDTTGNGRRAGWGRRERDMITTIHKLAETPVKRHVEGEILHQLIPSFGADPSPSFSLPAPRLACCLSGAHSAPFLRLLWPSRVRSSHRAWVVARARCCCCSPGCCCLSRRETHVRDADCLYELQVRSFKRPGRSTTAFLALDGPVQSYHRLSSLSTSLKGV